MISDIAPEPTRPFVTYLRAMRRRLPLLILLPLVAAGAAYAVSDSETKRYDATSKVLLEETEPVNSFLDPNAQGRTNDPEREINTRVALIKLERVAERVRRRLRLPIGQRPLLDKVTTEIEENSRIVSITARDEDPARATAIANAFADAYLHSQREAARRGLTSAARVARSRLAELGPEEVASQEGRELRADLRQLEIAAAGQTGGVEVIRRATVPSDAATPRPLRSAALGLLLGLVLAVAAALALELADRRLRDQNDVEALFGMPVLAAVPQPRRRFHSVRPGDDPGQREGYSALATNLRFFELGAEPEAVLVTSASPSEGKTSVTLGTARALATLGMRVIAIEADLRRPTFGSYELGRADTGLSTLLAGVGQLEDELVEVSARTFSPTAGLRIDGPSFAVVPAGPLPPNPPALLARRALGEVIRDARAIADVVLIDAPPIATVNDPVLLAAHVDGVVLVARLNQTRRDAARRALGVLGNLDARTLGVVVTGAPSPSDAYYADLPAESIRDEAPSPEAPQGERISP